MLKTLLKVGTVVTLLLGCYFGYVRAFDALVRQFEAKYADDIVMFPPKDSRSKQRAKELARRAVGPDHWAVTSELPFTYYNAERGFWMYAREYKEVQEENGVRYDGKRVKLWPFLVIWTSRDGKNIQVLTADRATLDMNQPVGLNNQSNSEGIKVKHAFIEGDVRIRDDRGTPAVAADDLKVGPLTYLEFDDDTQQITSESHVIIQDPDQTITGDGLVIQLRKRAAGEAPTASSSGFGGVEYAILQKNPRVAMRDVGNTGFLPAGGPPAANKAAAPGKTADYVVTQGGKEAPSPSNGEPVPLIIVAKGLMRIDMPPDPKPVVVGPPEPPAPTLVRFERNVVALHGRANPNQLDCDTLRLTLVPGPQPAAPGGKDRARRKAKANAPAAGAQPEPTAVASAGPSPSVEPKAGPAAGAGDGSPPPAEGAGQPSKGLFGNLTLQKAHATGHAVWLQMRDQGTKVRCSEMIHERCMPYRPDFTLFRGEPRRQIWMEKIDYEPDEPAQEGGEAEGQLAQAQAAPDRARRIKSVTHVVTVTATIYDRGNGMDLADVRALGPGQLDSRPGPREPVERTAIWQDELTIVNVLGPDKTLQQKQVTLTGTRPVFVDRTRDTVLDSAQELKVFLRPRTSPQLGPTPAAAAPAGAGPGLASHVAAKPPGDGGAVTGGPGGGEADATSGLGNSLQIERLVAHRDVHFVAPNRRMEARRSLDAVFIEVDPAPAAGATAPATEEGAAAEAVAEGPPSPDAPVEGAPRAEAPVAAKEAEPQEPAGQAMTGVADRIRAVINLPRGKQLEGGKGKRRKKAPTAPGERTALALADAPASQPSTTPPPAPESKEAEAEAEVREAWLFGNVALHQDAAPDPNRKDKAKPQGDDICGEAVYLDNKGEGKASVRVFHRDPTDPTPIPGPIRWAKVSTDDMIVYGETLWMDQEKDQIWAIGPGTLNQWTDRNLMTDKSSGAKPPAEGAQPAAASKPRRAGRVVGDKDLLTITWTKSMEFFGRTKDPLGNPAGRANFFGIVDAKMTDATLHCEETMIVFTDREVPLKKLGPATGGKSGLPDGDENAERAGAERSRVDIALIYCYGKPTAISRKVDPDLPRVVEQERIDAWLVNMRRPVERLDYNRRTGEFFVWGPGMVFLYDRPEEKNERGDQGDSPGAAAGNGGATRGRSRSSGGRTITPTSGRSADRTNGRTTAVGRDGAAIRPGADPATPAVNRKILPLVLMQVKFTRGMKGRVGAGQADDTNQERWSEFYGNIECLRSQVNDDALRPRERQEILSPDQRLSEDGFYLTSQMMRIIQEPPPPGSPDKTPAKSWAKAWDHVHINKGEAMSIEADVATYDSSKDLIQAYGEGGHGVSMVQQHAPGQPASVSQGQAVYYNLRSRTGRTTGADEIQMVDKRTGSRPSLWDVPDPTRPPKPKPRQGFRIPPTTLERRGFTGY